MFVGLAVAPIVKAPKTLCQCGFWRGSIRRNGPGDWVIMVIACSKCPNLVDLGPSNMNMYTITAVWELKRFTVTLPNLISRTSLLGLGGRIKEEGSAVYVVPSMFNVLVAVIVPNGQDLMAQSTVNSIGLKIAFWDSTVWGPFNRNS